MENNEKKTKKVDGKVVGNITIGEPAVIETSKGTLRTSCVLHTVAFADGRIYVETLNTRYWVFPAVSQ